ncbi:MAG: hypothetical protein Ta2B_09610 [Termitinemataceae bacterium]|nr:MAG: hypothetical protein Ta2B_09610 [Termitinemataceae bacterium]
MRFSLFSVLGILRRLAKSNLILQLALLTAVFVLFASCDDLLDDDEQDPGAVEESWKDDSVSFPSENFKVVKIRSASGPLAQNIVIIGDGYLAEDNLPGGKWDKKGRELAADFLKAPVIRDYIKSFGVYIFYADSQNITAPGVSTPFKPGGGAGPRYHPDDGAVKAYAQKVPWLKDQDYAMCYIVNLGHQQWEAMVHGDEAYGANDSNYQWLYHEYIGHAFAGLADEYAAAAGGNIGDLGYGSGVIGVNVSGHGFPADKTIAEINWPDVPGGPMAWADEIFGDVKGDGFIELRDNPPPRGGASYDFPDLSEYFPANPRATNSVGTAKTWPHVSEGHSSTWPDDNLQHWAPWVVFIGRTGYTRAVWGGSFWKHSQWIRGMGGTNHRWNADDACSMRQDGGGNNSMRFCAGCRYRIWAEIQMRAYKRGSGELYIDNKFPSEQGLREFVPYDKSTNYGLYDRSDE